ncbi:unnamed protein product, partial [Amoebophrya sp. A25]
EEHVGSGGRGGGTNMKQENDGQDEDDDNASRENLNLQVDDEGVSPEPRASTSSSKNENDQNKMNSSSEYYRAPSFDIFAAGLVFLEILTGRKTDQILRIREWSTILLGRGPSRMSTEEEEKINERKRRRLEHQYKTSFSPLEFEQALQAHRFTDNCIRPVQQCSDAEFAALLQHLDISGEGLPDPLARDLLRRMLMWDPARRISAPEALRHPWFLERKEARLIPEGVDGVVGGEQEGGGGADEESRAGAAYGREGDAARGDTIRASEEVEQVEETTDILGAQEHVRGSRTSLLLGSFQAQGRRPSQ